MLQRFGYDRKSANQIAEINTALKERGLYALPHITADMDTGAMVQLYNYLVQQLGSLFKKEIDLEEFVFQSKAYLKLGIQEVARSTARTAPKAKLILRTRMREIRISCWNSKTKAVASRLLSKCSA